MLQHMRSLQPGEQEGVMFRYVFVSLLPDVVREVVTSMESLDDMAKTAGDILQSNASARISALAQSSQLAHDFDDHVALVQRNSPRPASSSALSNDLCKTHVRYGRDAFKCDRPGSCPMARVTSRRPSGNGNAGRR